MNIYVYIYIYIYTYDEYYEIIDFINTCYEIYYLVYY